MPNYTFEDTNTGEVHEMTMRISERDEFVKDNPHMKQLITGAPMVVSGWGGIKTDDGFKEVLSKAAEAHPNSPLGERYGKKSIKDIKTQEVVNKHRKNWSKN